MHRSVSLSDEEREQLRALVRHGQPAYVRERAACILKVGEGQVAAQVAAHGLLQRRDPDTIYSWLDRFAKEGIAGLRIRPGRGRKPAFPPREPDAGTGAHTHSGSTPPLPTRVRARTDALDTGRIAAGLPVVA